MSEPRLIFTMRQRWDGAWRVYVNDDLDTEWDTEEEAEQELLRLRMETGQEPQPGSDLRA